MTQGIKNNIHIRIRRICLLRIIFIFVFVHQKNYSLHSGFDASRKSGKGEGALATVVWQAMQKAKG